jgi:flagellar biosynthetic protein FliR
MPPFLEPFASGIVVFVLVLSRVGAMLSVAPLWGSRAVPVRIRAMLAVMLALLVCPMHHVSLSQTDFLPLALEIGKESALGLAMGATLTILFSSLQIAGQLIAQTSGLSLAESYDPSQDETVPVFSQLLDQLGLTVFVLLGGHRQALHALLDSFTSMPPGKAELPPDLVMAMTEVLSNSCALGLRVLNMMNMGLGVNAILAVLVLALTIGSLPWLFDQDPLAIWKQLAPAVSGHNSALPSPGE